ncbi:MAG: hypothetical protein M3069_20945 [Chloroflexota bacterium]|nr:hypothetical protein [Chloroflexota bacterium]
MTSVDVQDGRPVVHVQQATVAGAAVPETTRFAIEGVLQGEVDDAVARARFDVDTVRIGEGTLTVRGHRQ